jgi:hypothetical protein
MQKQSTTDAAPINVFITVAGGVAYVASAPESVKVHIIDYDNLKADFDKTFQQLAPAAQDYYRQTEMASTPSGC